jgi:hemerythrin superfamily protein
MTNALPPMGTSLDIVALVEADHRTAAALLAGVRSAEPSARAELWPGLLHFLAVHEVAEERVVFPAIRAVTTDAGPLLDARIEEQKAAEELLVSMEETDPASAVFADLLARLEAAVLAHAEAEEQHILPIVVAHDESLDRTTLGARYEAAKRKAPTHPHPDAPHRPPGNLVGGPVVSIMDRGRDHLR